MFIGEGRHVTIAVVATGFVLIILLAAVVVIGIEDYGPMTARALGAHVTPPPDPARAGSRPTGNPGTWFGPDAYPAEAIRRDEQGRTVAVLDLDAAGWATTCHIKTSSGSASLDKATCSIALRHARFDPARDRPGVAIASQYTLPVRWVLPQD